MSTSRSNRGLRLLSLDGGGIRGLSELAMLHEIMARIQHRENLARLPKPCEYFDLIGGTSTGGLAALLLGRLQLSTEQAITEYGNLASLVFKEKKSGWLGNDGQYKATKLETVVKELVQKYSATNNPDESMLDARAEEPGACKTFVCAAPADNLACPTLFRTYRIPDASFDCKIWEAARATCAAPTLFKRIRIGAEGTEQEYIDAGLGCYNPVFEVVAEADVAFGKDQKVDCLISLGSGQKGVIALKKPNWFQKMFPTDAIPVLERLSMDSEIAAEQMQAWYHRHWPGVYYRLNVEQGMQDIGVGEWKRLGEVLTHTTKYIQGGRISVEVDTIVDKIIGS